MSDTTQGLYCTRFHCSSTHYHSRQAETEVSPCEDRLGNYIGRYHAEYNVKFLIKYWFASKIMNQTYVHAATFIMCAPPLCLHFLLVNV